MRLPWARLSLISRQKEKLEYKSESTFDLTSLASFRCDTSLGERTMFLVLIISPNFPTIDPAPSSSADSIPTLKSSLLNTSLPLFERYRAMFALRDYGASSKESILALADGFNDDSALFRHEIAYIFGQLCSPYSVPSLLHVLRDDKEEEMVRHEAAEALGGIASDGTDVEDASLPSGGVLQILREWAVKEDAPVVVRESCQVAIDMWEVSHPAWPVPDKANEQYENSTEQFNPLDSLTADKAHTTGMERSAHAAIAAGVVA